MISSHCCLFICFSRIGDVINLGDRQLTVLHMPGHSRGSICLHDRDNKLLFSGDVVYDGAMIDWLPYSRVSDYISSCERLVGLVDSEQVTLKQTRLQLVQSILLYLLFQISWFLMVRAKYCDLEYLCCTCCVHLFKFEVFIICTLKRI